LRFGWCQRASSSCTWSAQPIFLRDKLPRNFRWNRSFCVPFFSCQLSRLLGCLLAAVPPPPPFPNGCREAFGVRSHTATYLNDPVGDRQPWTRDTAGSTYRSQRGLPVARGSQIQCVSRDRARAYLRTFETKPSKASIPSKP